MATVHLEEIAHSYRSQPRGPADYALKPLDMTWRDGGSYALLGPSGCGKTTLLNIISGLVRPSSGRIRFDGRDVTAMPTEARNIAQVFQFPVIYDTMTVYENLAFPLRNRGLAQAEVDRRVREVAALLELTPDLAHRARRLTADAKQKISLGRGLVRRDVAAILFDEPLTVIDPQLKWHLRRKLREIHQELKLTLIYVTHDQVEALTFAERVAVMHDGAIAQFGTPQELFERPQHTFVGYFIGSPGMNILPCGITQGGAVVDGITIPLPEALTNGLANKTGDDGQLELGIRPEFVEIDAADRPGTVPVSIAATEHWGTHRVVTARLGNRKVKVKTGADAPLPADPGLRFPPAWTRIYRDGRLAL